MFFRAFLSSTSCSSCGCKSCIATLVHRGTACAFSNLLSFWKPSFQGTERTQSSSLRCGVSGAVSTDPSWKTSGRKWHKPNVFPQCAFCNASPEPTWRESFSSKHHTCVLFCHRELSCAGWKCFWFCSFCGKQGNETAFLWIIK